MNKRLIIILSAILTLLVLSGFLIWNMIYSPNVTPVKGHNVFYIPTGADYPQVLDTLRSSFEFRNRKVFNWLAEKKGYPQRIRPGRYVVKNNISYNELLNILRAGRQTPVRVTFSNIRTVDQVAGKAGRKLEADSASLSAFFSDESNFKADGFSHSTIISVFIPDTYEFFWNTDARGFYTRMLREYRHFWNEERLRKAQELGLSPVEVATLASIIDDEVVKKDEKPRIAGVYINRLKRGMPLQACPTIKFAMNDFTITRILLKYLDVVSPYNTYRNSGLPPGPIGCASVEGLDAVLNAEKHEYLFFAAKSDFSGYHNFSRTLTEHNRYAAAYQRELDRRKIFK